MKVQYQELYDRVKSILIKSGLSEDDAGIVVDEILFAEARGKKSHGLNMLEVMIKRAKKPHKDVLRLKETSSYCLFDFGGKVGPVAAKMAMDSAIEKATEMGISIVGVRNPSPFLTAGYNAWRAAKHHNMVSMIMSVAKSKVAPYGTRKAIIGTNPIAFGFPAEPYPIVIDMAITKIPAADVNTAKKRSERLPVDVAYDSFGNITREPDEALKGALIPFGSYKGSAIGLMVELLSGAFLEAKCGLRAGDMRGMLFIVIKADLFAPIETIKKRASDLRDDIQKSAGINGEPMPIVPGDRAECSYEVAIKEGMDIEDDMYQMIFGTLQS